MSKEPVNPLPHRAIRAFVWDLADEGIDEVLGRISDCNFDGLHLALAHHGGRFYCPHNPKHALVHAPDGAVYFQPLMSCYDQILPRVHPEYGSGAFVARTRDRAKEFGLNLTAWVVLFNNMTLAAENPDCVCKNALGDPLEGALCPSNPAVRDYALALIEDLAHRVGVNAIELEEFTFPSHASYVGPSWRQVPLGPHLGYLLSLCFCDDCRKRAEEANIEIEDLSHRVERMIRRGLSGDISDRRIGDEIADPYHPISRLTKVRFETVTSLIDDMLDEINGSPVALQLIVNEEPDGIWRWGLEPHILRQRDIRATLQSPHSQNAVAPFVARYAEVLQLGGNLAADIHLLSPDDEEHSPAGIMEACLNVGVDRFVFSHYGLATYDMLDWACLAAKK